MRRFEPSGERSPRLSQHLRAGIEIDHQRPGTNRHRGQTSRQADPSDSGGGLQRVRRVQSRELGGHYLAVLRGGALPGKRGQVLYRRVLPSVDERGGRARDVAQVQGHQDQRHYPSASAEKVRRYHATI